MPTIILARHAQASFGAANYDVLSPLGVLQGAALAEDLARRTQVDRVISGTLTRQLDTAAAIAGAAGCEVRMDPGWDEYDDGDILTHHSTSAARLSRPAGSDAPSVSAGEFQAALESALLSWIAAGSRSDTTEPWPAFSARVSRALQDVATTLSPGETAVVCTSAGVLATACVALLGLPPEALLPFNRVSVNTSLTKVAHGRRGMTLISFNDHAHLERPEPSLITYR